MNDGRKMPTYMTNIVEPYISDITVLMYDNAHPHVAIVVGQYFVEFESPTLNWPARSSKFNRLSLVSSKMANLAASDTNKNIS